MTSNKQYTNISYSNLVNRRDFKKIDTNFIEPDLLELQRKSFSNFNFLIPNF